MDWLDIAVPRKKKALSGFVTDFLQKRRGNVSAEMTLIAGMFLGLTSFWNGAAVIGGLLILLGFAVFQTGSWII